jgi:hypothetical protein
MAPGIEGRDGEDLRPLSEVRLVVTDASADPAILDDLAGVGCDVQVAGDAR